MGRQFDSEPYKKNNFTPSTFGKGFKRNCKSWTYSELSIPHRIHWKENPIETIDIELRIKTIGIITCWFLAYHCTSSQPTYWYFNFIRTMKPRNHVLAQTNIADSRSNTCSISHRETGRLLLDSVDDNL